MILFDFKNQVGGVAKALLSTAARFKDVSVLSTALMKTRDKIKVELPLSKFHASRFTFHVSCLMAEYDEYGE